MNCPKCGVELGTIIRGLYPVEQRDEVRLLGGDPDDGLRAEFTGEMEIKQFDHTEDWVACPACGEELDEVIPGGVEFVASPTPAVESVPLAGGAEARGRNGWFTPTEVSVQRSNGDGTVSLSVRSSRAYSDMPPVWLSLCREDAEAVHQALARQIAALHAAEVTS